MLGRGLEQKQRLGMVSLVSLGTRHGVDRARVGASLWEVSRGAPELLS